MLFVLPIIVNPTYGHASALLEGIDAHVTASGATVIEASFGLLWSGGPDAPWRWLCHEAVTLEGAVIAPRYAITSNDVIVAVVPALSQTRETSLPVYWSADQCAWTASEGLAGVPVIDVAAHPANPELVIAISADITDQSGGAVYRSRDGGQTFSPLRIDSDRYYRTISFGADGDLWIAAAWYEEPRGWVMHSSDSGDTWTEHRIPQEWLSIDEEVDVDVDVLAAKTDEALIAVGPFRDDSLLRLTTDGAFQQVLYAAAEVTDAEYGDENLLYIAKNGETFHRVDADGVHDLNEAPIGQGIGVESNRLLLATRSRIDGTQLVESVDRGESFSLNFHLSDLQAPPTCPTDSEVALRCEPLWPALEERLPLPPEQQGGGAGDDESDTGEHSAQESADQTSTEAGCSRQTKAAGLLLLAPLSLWRRRR